MTDAAKADSKLPTQPQNIPLGTTIQNTNHWALKMQVMSYLDEANRRLDLYSIEFESPDGVYSVGLYAISSEHAQMQLQALKETGKVLGQVDRIIDTKRDDDED